MPHNIIVLCGIASKEDPITFLLRHAKIESIAA